MFGLDVTRQHLVSDIIELSPPWKTLVFKRRLRQPGPLTPPLGGDPLPQGERAVFRSASRRGQNTPLPLWERSALNEGRVRGVGKTVRPWFVLIPMLGTGTLAPGDRDTESAGYGSYEFIIFSQLIN